MTFYRALFFLATIVTLGILLAMGAGTFVIHWLFEVYLG